MRGAESARGLNGDVENFGQFQRFFIENLAQGYAFDVFADDVVRAVRFADFVND